MNYDVSRTNGNIYEKKDKSSWLLLPDYSEGESTSFLDACDLVYYRKEPSESKKDLDIRSIFSNAL